MGFLNMWPFAKKKNEEDDFEQTIGEYDQYLLTALSPSYIKEEVNYVQLGSNFTRTLVVVDFATVLSQEDIQELSELSSNVSITYHFERKNSGVIRQQLGQAIKQGKKKVVDANLDEASKVDAQVQMDSAGMVIRELASGSDVMYDVHMLVHLNAPSLKELDRLTQIVKSQIGPIGTAHNPDMRAFDAFESFLPLGKNKIPELTSRMMNSEAVSYFFPFHENEMFDEDGVFVGINGKTKNVILVDDSQLLNKHKFYIGISGVGKSTSMFADMAKKWGAGTRIAVNDPKGEFGEKFKNMGGEWIRFSMTGGSRLNMFDLPRGKYQVETDEYINSENPIYDKIPSLVITFKLMYPDMNDLEENIINELIEETYTIKGITKETKFSNLKYEDYPTLSDFNKVIDNLKADNLNRYQYIEKFHMGIQVYITGSYSELFNGHTNVNVYNDLVTYDTLAFQQNEKIQRIIYYLIMSHMTYTVINGDGKDTQLYFDECHVIADPKIPLAMQQLYFMLKVLRSFNVGVSTATQSIKDFLSAVDGHRNYGEAVINQSVQRMYLPMQESEIAFLESNLSHTFSEKEKSILTVREGNKKEQAGKGILFVGSKKVQCNVKLTDVEAAIWFDNKKIDEIPVA
ncbi:VirB4 family type IV secretion system protein [Bacillus sp. 1P06AnD]|uniref:VirB4 family type IV secretion system protein n=1 Tax=Bacillus sp. 1P06AnD TaxID=3132208 RepID=UPI0039A3CDA4